jgi:hypothetical protein
MKVASPKYMAQNEIYDDDDNSKKVAGVSGGKQV